MVNNSASPLEKMMIQWCEDGAEVALRHHRRTGELAFKYASEAVTEADGEIETLLRSRIGAAFPDDLIVGEEMGGPADGNIPENARVWQIDPIDGTLNYALGMPNYCISLALLQGEKVLAACIHQPATGDVFCAEAGRGARLNGQKMSVSTDRELKDSIVSMHLKKQGLVMQDPQLLHTLASAPMRLRRCGAVALEMAWVAAGSCDLLVASFKGKIHPWDVAAGLLLVEEAGGVAVDFQGSPYAMNGPEMMVGSPRVARQMTGLFSASS
jgi:myo-inositol-1(or 4)-monophosphatase